MDDLPILYGDTSHLLTTAQKMAELDVTRRTLYNRVGAGTLKPAGRLPGTTRSPVMWNPETNKEQTA